MTHHFPPAALPVITCHDQKITKLSLVVELNWFQLLICSWFNIEPKARVQCEIEFKIMENVMLTLGDFIEFPDGCLFMVIHSDTVPGNMRYTKWKGRQYKASDWKPVLGNTFAITFHTMGELDNSHYK